MFREMRRSRQQLTREEAEAFYPMVGKLTRNLNECPLADEPEEPKG